MKILIVIKNSPAHSYLFTITTKETAEEINGQVRDGAHSKAIDTVFKKGVFEREVGKSEMPSTKAKLVLSDYNARWDLTK